MQNLVAEQQVITACESDARVRMDQFLVQRLPQYSRSLIAKFIKNGSITAKDGRAVKASQIIVGDEAVYFTRPQAEPATMVAQDLPLEIIYSDDDLAVINKPAGLVVHPGAGLGEGTLCNALLYHFPTMSVGNVERPGIVHRLDKDTSGVMVIAKNEAAHRNLSQQFKDRTVEKIYRVFCFGEFAQHSFELKTGHARHKQHRLRYSTKITFETSQDKRVRFAHSTFRVDKSLYGFSLLTARIHTGRTHQIRAHLADIDHPVLGDVLYGGGKRVISERVPLAFRNCINELTGQALHAETLCFDHPVTGERMKFSSELPENLLRLATYFSP